MISEFEEVYRDEFGGRKPPVFAESRESGALFDRFFSKKETAFGTLSRGFESQEGVRLGKVICSWLFTRTGAEKGLPISPADGLKRGWYRSCCFPSVDLRNSGAEGRHNVTKTAGNRFALVLTMALACGSWLAAGLIEHPGVASDRVPLPASANVQPDEEGWIWAASPTQAPLYSWSDSASIRKPGETPAPVSDGWDDSLDLSAKSNTGAKG